MLKDKSVLPGFGLSFGITVVYLSLMILLPLSMVLFKLSSASFQDIWQIMSSARVVAAYKLSFAAALAASLTNVVFGLLVAWVLVRYSFPGKKLLDAMIDLPFALPTAVAGIALTAIYARNGIIGSVLAKWEIGAAFNPFGVFIALTFVGLPFVVRNVQPVLEQLEPELEEAAAIIGAKPWQIFWHVIMGSLWPALLTGFSMSFARALGEYGSVVFISGNMPLRTEIVPLLIMSKLDQFDYLGATVIAFVMLAISFAIMFAVNRVQSQRHIRGVL